MFQGNTGISPDEQARVNYLNRCIITWRSENGRLSNTNAKLNSEIKKLENEIKQYEAMNKKITEGVGKLKLAKTSIHSAYSGYQRGYSSSSSTAKKTGSSLSDAESATDALISKLNGVIPSSNIKMTEKSKKIRQHRETIDKNNKAIKNNESRIIRASNEMRALRGY